MCSHFSQSQPELVTQLHRITRVRKSYPLPKGGELEMLAKNIYSHNREGLCTPKSSGRNPKDYA